MKLKKFTENGYLSLIYKLCNTYVFKLFSKIFIFLKFDFNKIEL